ncbi:DTW domain-containing protein [Pollutimonas subterranea]|uniref:tRNA-uridine aminocarboxypropyltransferase n=1 Tax=Pollutimonas subterranea TaxID=2045210 RepID=A0A2N4U1V1_9BURK|nr:tRNA-uridine aminocarboxypropyltransferase [Pollutimonas subterranea]PLC48987.1 DTW domain-containing protein [Pollutimonas subterranea]
MNPSPPSRPRCERCLRPASHCLCAHVRTVANRTHVLLLQHPSEYRHALNTGRLAALGLQRSQVLVGEHFPDLDAIVAEYHSVFLLFPGDGAVAPQPLVDHTDPNMALLIVPDGTWRKARKILYANPILATLPRLSLENGPPSSYRLRQTREPAAVSTIEAVVRTLARLEPDQDFSSVLTPFNVLIEQQIQAMGMDVYGRNYGGLPASEERN